MSHKQTATSQTPTMQLNIAYDLLPKQPTTRTSIVMDHFGIDFETGRHIVAEDLELPIAPGDVVLFTGPSGSGKSSLLRGVAQRLQRVPRASRPCPECADSHKQARLTQPWHTERSHVINIDELDLGERSLVDVLPLPVEESLRLLSSCGLGEAQLMLRTPAELSDGQRYRFRLALGLARRPDWLVSDEFTATLDRTLAQVVALNVRRLAERTGVGFLLATTHEDIAVDLAPDVHVRCRLEGEIMVERLASPGRESGDDAGGRRAERQGAGVTVVDPGPDGPRLTGGSRRVSFFEELEIKPGTKANWGQFARWHYRSANLGFVRQVWLLCRGEERIGICVFVSPPTSLKARNRYFGRSGKWERTSMQALNRQLVLLSRVVLHPTYRGAGIASWFVRECCERTGYRWVETLAQMGHINPLFERAGFVRMGSCPPPRERSRQQHSALYGNRVTAQTFRKSRQAEPVYYVWRASGERRAESRRTRAGDRRQER